MYNLYIYTHNMYIYDAVSHAKPSMLSCATFQYKVGGGSPNMLLASWASARGKSCTWQCSRFPRSFFFTNLRWIKAGLQYQAARCCQGSSLVITFHPDICFVLTHFVGCFDFSQLRLCTKVEMFGASKGTCQSSEAG